MTERPTIIQLIVTRERAGCEQHVAELSCGLRDLGWRCIIVSAHDTSLELQALYSSVAELQLLSAPGLWNAVKAVAHLARTEREAIIHAHMGRALQVATLAGWSTRTPVVTTMHFVLLAHQRGRSAAVAGAIFRRASRRAAAVISVSAAVQAMVATNRMAVASRSHIVHNGVGCLAAGTPLVEMPERPIVLCASRLSWEKQIDLLVRAMASAKVDAELWIAGRGEDESALRRLADELLPGRVRFLGYVLDVQALIDQVRVVAIPTRAEGFGIVAIEAMRRSRPVVGFRAGGLTEVVVDGVTGSLASPGDTRAFGSHLHRFAQDRELAIAMGAAGRQRFGELFTTAAMAAKTASVYRQVLSAE